MEITRPTALGIERMRNTLRNCIVESWERLRNRESVVKSQQE
jgi:hypothetical protein